MPLSIKGFSYSGALEDLNDSGFTRASERHVTVLPLGPNRAGLDTVAMGYYIVASDTAEASSDANTIVATSHAAIAGDLIRLKTTSNTITQREIAVRSIPSANSILLDGALDASISNGDTFDILRPVAQQFDSDGALVLSSSSDGLTKFTLDGVTTTVTEDTGTPANNVPLPVKLTSVTGDINITANDLQVQLSHSAANPDSVQIGDGTETANVNASNELQVADDTARTTLSAISGKLPAALGAQLTAASLAVNIASDQTVPISAASLPLPTGAATAANQATANASLSTIAGDTTSIDGKLPAALGQQARAASLSVALSTEDATSQSSIVTNTGTIAGAVSGTEMQVDLVDLGGAATAANQATGNSSLSTIATNTTNISGKLPASLGAKTGAASLSVVFASDATVPAETGRTIVDKARNDYTGTNVTTGAWVELDASLANNCNYIEIFDSSGQTLELGIGAPAAEVSQLYITPGGNGLIPFIASSADRIAIKAVSATADAGEIVVNFYS